MWCGLAPGRYIPLTLIPLWDPILARSRGTTHRRQGVQGRLVLREPINARSSHQCKVEPGITGSPHGGLRGNRNRYLHMHIGSSSMRYTMSAESPMLVTMSWAPPVMIAGTMIEWIFSPVVRKFPGIKVALAGVGGIGWMPFFLDRCEQVVLVSIRHWIGSGDVRHDSPPAHVELIKDSGVDLEGFSVMDTFHRHIYGCFIDDVQGRSEASMASVWTTCHESRPTIRIAIRPGRTASSTHRSNCAGYPLRTATRSCREARNVCFVSHPQEPPDERARTRTWTH